MIIRIIFYLLFGYIFLAVLLFLLQRQMIYLPSNIQATPAEYGVSEMEVVQLTTGDDLVLQAWFRPKKKEGMPTIIFFHGNAGHIGNRAVIAKPFLEAGYGFLLVTYRGYSGNPGSPSEEGFYQDGRAAMEFVKNEECLVIYGNSIGAAVAIQMAIEYPIKALVLQAPFSSLEDMAKYHYPIFPVAGLIKDRYQSIEKVVDIHVPALVIYGEQDSINPPEFSRRIYDALPGAKEVLAVPNRGHNDLFAPYQIIRFIEKYVACL